MPLNPNELTPAIRRRFERGHGVGIAAISTRASPTQIRGLSLWKWSWPGSSPCSSARTTLMSPADLHQLDALLKGDPDAWGVIKEGVMTKAREILPGKN